MKKILVIEDEAEQRLMMSWVLTSENFEVTLAENGREGLELAKKIKPDLIVSDINMPEIDGYEVLKALRDDVTTANIPFIFLTAEVEPESRYIATRLGADDYLTKPIDLKQLLLAIALQLKTISESQPPKYSIDFDNRFSPFSSWPDVSHC